MMDSFVRELIRSSDKFRFVLECSLLYKDIHTFRNALTEISGLLRFADLRKPCAAEIELALLRVRRFRYHVDNKTALAALERIREDVRGDRILEIKYDIVRAEFVLLRGGNAKESSELFEAVAAKLHDLDGQYLHALAANGLANAYMILGDEDRAEDHFQDAISMFRRMEYWIHYGYSLKNYGVLKKKLGQYAEAEKLTKKALLIFREAGFTEGEALCHNNLGILRFKLGDWSNSEYQYERVITLNNQFGSDGSDMARAVREGHQDLYLLVEINYQHLLLRKRRFDDADNRLSELLSRASAERHARNRALILEFLGELQTEFGDYEKACAHLAGARTIADESVPGSDVVTEIKRRQAQVNFLMGDLRAAREQALKCIRLSRKISDHHEKGAALRILGEVYAKQGLSNKAADAFEASIHTLKSINESYELMRSNIAYSEFLIEQRDPDADVALLEAKQLCIKLEIDYYMGVIMLLSSKYAFNNDDYLSARSYLRKAEEITETLQPCDQKKLKPQISKFYNFLEKSILKKSMESADKLKSLGRIYEEARFPIEELKPELAADVARNVRAEQLFLVRKQGPGFSVPLKYNISAKDAKRLAQVQERKNEKLFVSKDPVIAELPTGDTMVCVAGQSNAKYILCTIIPKDQNFSPRELEFLFASVEVMERVAEEYTDVSPYLDMDDFMDGRASRLKHPGGHFQDILTLDPDMIKIIHLAERASGANVPILLEGETGVGKELFAQAMHLQSPRKSQQFIAMNAGGLPLNLLESQLFGHVKGAFTDAVTNRHGLIEEARGGTIFFDEVGEMAEELQVKLLRLLENGEYRRLGENKLRIADVRIISATNKDLERLVEKGEFREDLFYRLVGVRFKIPPLRDRKRDIEFLVRHFINEGFIKIGRPGRKVSVDMKVLEAFELYDWPGNIRELKNEMLRILSLIGDGELVRFGMLSDRIKASFKAKDKDGGLLTQRVERFERRLILKALDDNQWNRVKTASEIGIPRTTLLFKMKRLNIAS